MKTVSLWKLGRNVRNQSINEIFLTLHTTLSQHESTDIIASCSHFAYSRHFQEFLFSKLKMASVWKSLSVWRLGSLAHYQMMDGEKEALYRQVSLFILVISYWVFLLITWIFQENGNRFFRDIFTDKVLAFECNHFVDKFISVLGFHVSQG